MYSEQYIVRQTVVLFALFVTGFFKYRTLVVLKKLQHLNNERKTNLFLLHLWNMSCPSLPLSYRPKEPSGWYRGRQENFTHSILNTFKLSKENFLQRFRFILIPEACPTMKMNWELWERGTLKRIQDSTHFSADLSWRTGLIFFWYIFRTFSDGKVLFRGWWRMLLNR